MGYEIAQRVGLVLILAGVSLLLKRRLLGVLPDATRDPVQGEVLRFVEEGWLRWGWFVGGLGMLLLVLVVVIVLVVVVSESHTATAAAASTRLTDREVFFGGAWRTVLVPTLVLVGLHVVAIVPLEEELRWRWYWIEVRGAAPLAAWAVFVVCHGPNFAILASSAAFSARGFLLFLVVIGVAAGAFVLVWRVAGVAASASLHAGWNFGVVCFAALALGLSWRAFIVRL